MNNPQAPGDGTSGAVAAGMSATSSPRVAQRASLPIGVFDSGVGGLTVARAIASRLPNESIIYFGDTLRCPYGPRPLDEVRLFARQISCWLARQDVKLIVIACNSATAAGLETVQREFDVPVVGVIGPGARAAVQATTSRRIGVIGTVATVESGAYTRAIRSLDAGMTVFSAATPRFVEIVEQGLRLDRNLFEDIMAQASAIYIRPAFSEIARDYLNPLKRCMIDTLVLGCTHYPLLASLIQSVVGPSVRIISSAEETARDVAEVLGRRGQLAQDGHTAHYRFATTTTDPEEFVSLGSAIFLHPLEDLTLVSLEDLSAPLSEKECL
ncbi:MAG: glutamate racemase [Coriobacteriales bacterium]|jgi:glutamate racemase|nr:glutamate racemase [Coriobacteriales bacterium]